MASTGPAGAARGGTGPGGEGAGGDAADNPEWRGWAWDDRHRRGQSCGACGWPYVHRNESPTGHGFCTNLRCHRSAAAKEARRSRYTENSWSGSVSSRWHQSHRPHANEAEPEGDAATGLIDLTGAAPGQAAGQKAPPGAQRAEACPPAGQGPSRDAPVGPPLGPEPAPLLGPPAGASADGPLRRRRWADPAGPIAMETSPMGPSDGPQTPPPSPPAAAEASASSPESPAGAPGHPSLPTDADLANAAGGEVPVHCLVEANWPRVALACPTSGGLMRTVVVNCECRFCLPFQNTIRAHLASRFGFTII